MRRCGRKIIDKVAGRALAAMRLRLKQLGRVAAPNQPMRAAPAMMIGKGMPKQKDADEGQTGDDQHQAVAQGAPADADHRLEHDGEHRRLEPEEQRTEPGCLLIKRIGPWTGRG